MLTRVYRLIWLLLHLLLSLGETLRWLQAATLRWSYDCLRRRSDVGSASSISHQRDVAFLERCKQELEKLPRHITIIVGSDDCRFDEELLTRLLSYSLIMDIGCISIYDTRPLRRGSLSLVKVRAPEGLRCKQLNNRRCIWTTTPTTTTPVSNGSKPIGNGIGNGHKIQQPALLEKSIEIREISVGDGHGLIAEVCRALYEEYHLSPTVNSTPSDTALISLLSDRTQLQQRIGAELGQRLDGISEPELGLVFGRCTCTYGLLPWHTRFTEFQNFEMGSAFSATTFAHALYKYSRCEQRWGR